MEYRAKTYSEDGTIKYILDVNTKERKVSIETAFVHLPGRENGKPAYVLCLSSLIGCVYKCLMCANTIRGHYHGILTLPQIGEQINLVLQQDGNLEKITKAGCAEYAFMAIGEPLYGMNVINAIKNHEPLVKDTQFSLSTVGAKGYIEKMIRNQRHFKFPVRLEVSLHFSNDALRKQWIMPGLFGFNTSPELDIKHTLEKAEEYANITQQKVALNYMLIDGINNLDSSIEELSKLIKPDIFYVKVMHPNLTSSLMYSWKEKGMKTYLPKEFRQKLSEAGIPATSFKSKGKDIFAGCGMMAARETHVKGVFQTSPIPEADPSKVGF